MKFCGKCGTKIEDNIKFCPGCGSPTDAPQEQQSQQAQGYANATREQALIIAVRMVENLKK